MHYSLSCYVIDEDYCKQMNVTSHNIYPLFVVTAKIVV